MSGARMRVGTLCGKVALALFALALLLRAMIPAGFMPVAGKGFAIELCTGVGAVSAWVDDQGNVHKGKPGDSKPEHPCAFANLSAALDLPTLGESLTVPSLATSALLGAGMAAVAIGRGLAAPPPPPTGPPFSL